MKMYRLIWLCALLGIVGVGYWNQSPLFAGEQPSLNVSVACQADAIQLTFVGADWPSEPTAFYLNDALLTAVSTPNATLDGQWTISPIPQTLSVARVVTANVEKSVLLTAPCLAAADHEAYLPITQKDTNVLDVDGTVPTLVNNGFLLVDEFGFGELSGSVQQWQLNLDAGEMVTGTFATQPDVNGVLTVKYPNGNLEGIELVGDGQLETLFFEATATGTYSFYLNGTDLDAGQFMIHYFTQNSLPLYDWQLHPQTDNVSGDIEEDIDEYWVFYFEQDDVVSITVNPTETNADLFITLWSEDGDIAESDEGVGESERIESFFIPTTGIYILQIGEWDFDSTSYTLAFQKE
ncbi:MAG: hypothetical protein AAF490_22535 [Chloroflexota bacterium]